MKMTLKIEQFATFGKLKYFSLPVFPDMTHVQFFFGFL